MEALPSEAKLRDEAYEELVADAMSEMLADDAAYEKLAKLKSQNKTLWEKIGEAIRAMLDKIKGALGIYKEADSALPAEARAARELSSDVYTKLQDLYVKAFVEADENFDGTDKASRTSDSNVKLSIRNEYASEIDAWNKDGMPDDEVFILGSTGDVLQGLGAIENDIYINGNKIKEIFKDHPEITIDEIKKIPQILENPILVLASKNKNNASQNSRMVMFGSVKAKNGLPVLTVMDLRPSENHIVIDDMQKVNSTYTKTSNSVDFIKSSQVLYVEKSKATLLLRSIGFQMPIELNKSGFVGSISYRGRNVKLSGESFSKIFSEVNSSTESDTKFSLRGSSGNDLSEAQQRFFENSKVRDDDGNLLVVYHGSPSVFTEFSHKYMSQHGSAEGQGFYFTDKKSMAEGYKKDGGQLLEGYLNIEKPLSDSEVTLKRSEVKKLIETIDPTGDDILVNYDPQGGMGYPSRAWYTRALDATVNQVMKYSDSDSEILADIANSGVGTKTVVSNIRQLFGYDGYIVKGKYDEANVYVAFESNQFKNKDNKTPTSNSDIRYSLRKPYSYESLVSKPDIKLTQINSVVQYKPTNDMRKTAVTTALTNAKNIGKVNSTGGVVIHVDDMSSDVIISRKSLEHGLDRRFSENLPATLKAGEILKNAIRINELTPKIETAQASYALIGAAKSDNGDLTIVEFVVNDFTNEVESIEVLKSINAKKEVAVLNAPPPTNNSLRITTSTISIAQLLEYVNKYFPDILPESVLRHYGYDARPKGELGKSALYSARQTAMKEMRERLQANQVDTDKIMELADKYYKDTGGHMSKSRMRYKFLAIADQIMSDYDAAFEDIEALAADIVNDPIPPADIADTLKEIRAHVRNVPLWITDHDKGEFGRYGGYNEFRKENMGRLRLTNYGFSPDSLYIELQGQYGKTYFPDVNTVAEMVIQIADVVNSDPLDHIDQFLYDDYYNADDDYEFKVSSIANDLTEIIADSWKRGGLDFTELNLLKESDLQSDGKLSDRELLANALESAAKSDSEKNMLAQYKKKIRRMSEEQKVLDNTKKVIKELSFQKGKRDTARIGTLKELVSKAENRINTYDRQLLRLESTSVLSEVIKREKQKAYEKANQVDMDNFEKLP